MQSPLPGRDAIEVRGLRRRFGARVALDGIDILVPAGEVYGFLGPNGAGKTTTIRCILGLIRRDAGEVAIFGETDPVRQRRGVGALVEVPRFHDWLSGRANLEIAAAYTPGCGPAEIERVLERVGLSDRAADRVCAYSHGMRQRLGLARSLLGRPRLLLLDEPTSGLDPEGIHDMRELLASLVHDDGITVLMSSHLLHEVDAVATRVGILRSGRMLAEGPVDELRGQSRVVELACPDHAALARATSEIDGAELLGPGESGRRRVGISGIEAGELNRALLARGVVVSELVQVRRSLEELFLDLTAAKEDR